MARRLLVRVTAGIARGDLRVLRPGDRLLVGRAPDAALSIPDPELSRRHLEVEWDGVTGHLVDLGSANGTMVNGSPVTDALLRSGDRVELGSTVLEIEVGEEARATGPPAMPQARGAAGSEAAVGATTLGLAPAAHEAAAPLPSPPVEIFGNVAPIEPVEEPLLPEPGSPAHALAALLDPSPDIKLYAIVDGALAVEAALAARVMGHRLYTLFSGDLAKEAAHAGPILVPITERVAFLSKWAETLGSNAGVLFEAPLDLDSIYPHLRHIFVVKDKEKQEYFLRFYDPRVLRGFLPTCTQEERAEFFGPVTRWISENEKGEAFEVALPQPVKATT